MKLSILMPVYNGQDFIKQAISNVLSQSFLDYELIIVDDCSLDKTPQIVKSIKDKRIKFSQNKKNLGYSGNLEKCRKKAKGEIIYLLAQDDILSLDALLDTYKAFRNHPKIGAVTRPYYWFDESVKKPVRAKTQLNPNKNEIVTINDNNERIVRVFQTFDQLSGLAFRKKFIKLPFHQDIFTCHIYPFADIFKKHPIVFLKDYNTAVRIRSSQTRSLSSIYNKSPMQSWIDMFSAVYPERKYDKFRKYFISNFVAKNYVGLIQIRNYGSYKYLLREIWHLAKYRWQNLFSFQFWFFSLGCLIMPPILLIPMVDWYKSKVLSRKIAIPVRNDIIGK